MKLVIVESPAKAKTIEGYLGSDYQVLSSVGHIMDLATSGPGGLGVDVENDFHPTYKVISGKKKVINELYKAALKADQVYIATDLDREGEAIGWHLANQLELDLNDKNRIVFTEITKNGILKGLEEPRKLNMDLVHSQETRRIIDRIMGFKLSGLLKNKIKVKSAGRVQSVALKMIVEREEEIKNFVSEKYAKLFATYKDLEFEYVKNDKQVGVDEINKLLDSSQNQDLEVISKTTKEKKDNPKAPYITSTFQQDAINQLKFSSKKAMSVAQKLYEGIEINGKLQGLITYMRTDSYRLSADFIKATKDYINQEYGSEYVGDYKGRKNKNAQEAHEAIRPTNINLHPDSIKGFLTPDQYKVYKLIYNRSLACVMSPAKQEVTTYKFKNEAGVEFKFSYTKYPFLGYRKLNPPEVKEYSDFNEGEVLNKIKYHITEHETQPQPRYTEARLIKELEENGVGRPSTYATIIDILKRRNYVEVVDKKFVPTEDGVLVTTSLDKFFNNIINVDYTASLEQELDEIAEANKSELEVLNDFYSTFIKQYDVAYKEMEKVAPKLVGEKCPECGSDLVERKGRYGVFVGCSNYPSCKYIKTSDKNIVADCPKCDGKIVKKLTKRGRVFYGCDNYPDCDYAVWKLEDLNKENKED